MLLSALSALAIGYVLLIILLYFMQGGLLYLPHIAGRALIATPADYQMAFDDVRLETDDGESLHGWFVPAPQRTRNATVLIFHGNAGNISHRFETLRVWHALGLDVFIFDYRGYGRSSGRPSEQGTYRDARAAWRYLTGTRSIPADRIVLFGRSLGGGVAAQLASEIEPAALILESTFTSVPDIAADIYWWLPVRWLARFRYDTRARLAEIRCPVLIVHSREDEIMPYAHAEALYAAASEPKRLLQIYGDHNMGFLFSDEVYRNGLAEFLEATGVR